MFILLIVICVVENYKLVGFVPALFPPSGFPLFNGTIISSAIKIGEKYVNENYLRNKKLNIEIFPIGVDNSSTKIDNGEILLDLFTNNITSDVIGIVGPSFSSAFEKIDNDLAFPCVSFAQRTIFNENEYFFRVVASNLFFLRSLLDTIYSLGFDEVIVLYDELSDYSTDNWLETFELCKSMGMVCVPVKWRFDGDIIHESQVVFNEIKTLGINCVMFTPGTALSYTDFVEFFNRAKSNAVFDGFYWFVTNILYNRMDLTDLHSVSNEPNLKGVIFVTTAEGLFPSLDYYRSEMKKLHPNAYTPHYRAYYDSVLAFGEAIRLMEIDNVDPSDPRLLMEYLYKVDVIGASGRIKFIQNMGGERSSHIIVKNINEKKILNIGKWRVENFYEWKVNEIVCPGDTILNKFRDIPRVSTKWLSYPQFGVSPSTSYGYCSVIYKQNLIIFGGGEGENGESSNDLYIFSFLTEKWKVTEPRDGFKPDPSKYHKCVVVKDQLYLFGGLLNNGERISSILYVFNLKYEIWERIHLVEIPPPRFGHGMIAIEHQNNNETSNIVIIYGGIGENSILNDVWVYSTENNKFSLLENKNHDVGPKGRYFHSFVKNSNNDLIIFGGITEFGLNPIEDTIIRKSSNSFWNLNLDLSILSYEWHKIEVDGLSKRNYHADSVINDNLYIFFGYSYEEGKIFNEILKFDISNITNLQWNNVSIKYENKYFNPRAEISVSNFQNNLVFFSGIQSPYTENEIIQQDLWVVDSEEMSFKEVYGDTYYPTPSKEYSSSLIGDMLYVFGGFSQEGIANNFINKFDLNSMKWEKEKIQGSNIEPRGRACHTRVRLSMFVFGGINEEGKIINDFSQFFPSSSSYKTVAFTGIAPSPRYECTMNTYNDRYVLLIGGIGENGEEFNDHFFIFDTQRKLWSKNMIEDGEAPKGLIGCSSTIVRNKIYFQGCSDKRSFSKSLYELDITERKWSKILDFQGMFSNTKSSLVHISGDNFLLFGGENSLLLLTNNLLMMNIKEQTVERISSKTNVYPPPQKNAQCHYFKNRLYCLTGVLGNQFNLGGNDNKTKNIDCAVPVENLFSLDVWGFNFDELHTIDLECSIGSKLNENGICEPCGIGKYYSEEDHICKNCSKGFYSNTEFSVSIANCLPCKLGSYNPIEGESGCLLCKNDSFCPLASHKQFDKIFETELREIFHPQTFSKPIMSISFISVGVYATGLLIWVVFVVFISVCWRLKVLKIENLLFFSLLFKSSHEDDYYNSYDPQPQVEKKSITGAYCTFFSLVIILLYIIMNLCFFFFGFDDEETVSLVPGISTSNKKEFEFDLSLTLDLWNYKSQCVVNISKCPKEIEVISNNLQFEEYSLSCSDSDMEKGKCSIMVEIKDCNIIDKDREIPISITVDVLTENSFVSKFDYHVSSSTGYGIKKSEIKGSIVGHENSAFRGLLPKSEVTLMLIRTKYEREIAFQRVEGRGYHLDWVSETVGSEVNAEQFSNENGFGFKCSFVESEQLLEIVRSNQNTFLTFIPNILGSAFGLLGAIGVLFKIFDYFYTKIGLKNDILEKGINTSSRIKRNIFNFKDQLLSQNESGNNDVEDQFTNSLREFGMKEIRGMVDGKKCKMYLEDDHLVVQYSIRVKDSYYYHDLVFLPDSEKLEGVYYTYAFKHRSDPQLKRTISVMLEYQKGFKILLAGKIKREKEKRIQKRRKQKEEKRRNGKKKEEENSFNPGIGIFETLALENKNLTKIEKELKIKERKEEEDDDIELMDVHLTGFEDDENNDDDKKGGETTTTNMNIARASITLLLQDKPEELKMLKTEENESTTKKDEDEKMSDIKHVVNESNKDLGEEGREGEKEETVMEKT